MSWSLVPASRFAEYASQWRDLHAASAASPLLAAEFVACLLDSFGSGREVLAWHRGSAEGAGIDAMAVLAPTRQGIWNTFQPSQAPVGLWLQRSDGAPDQLAGSLLAALPFPALALGLTQCDPMLTARPVAVNASVRVSDYIDTARITLAGCSFDDYWATRGKNLRNNLKKQRRALADAGIATALEVLRSPQHMAQAIADYGLLESTGWKGVQGSAVAADNAQGRFYRALFEAFAARGGASIYRYRIGGKVAAMDLCIEGGGCIIVLKTAYDEQLSKQLSPALLMREEVCRRLFEGGQFERIEFYGRVMEWHLRWTDEVRSMYHLTRYRWPVLGRLHERLRAAN